MKIHCVSQFYCNKRTNAVRPITKCVIAFVLKIPIEKILAVLVRGRLIKNKVDNTISKTERDRRAWVALVSPRN